MNYGIGIGIVVTDLARPRGWYLRAAPDVTKPFRDNAITPALLDSRREVGEVPAAIARGDVSRRSVSGERAACPDRRGRDRRLDARADARAHQRLARGHRARTEIIERLMGRARPR
jgi:hypothetical protein